MKKLLILVMLFSMSLIGCGKSFINKEYIYPTIPDDPVAPIYYPVEFQKVEDFYCLDNNGAKNLLKNKTLADDYINQYKESLNMLRLNKKK